MAGINRLALVAAGAKCTFGGGTFYNKSPVNIDRLFETTPLEVDALGKLSERTKEVSLKASIEPDGRFNADLIAALWPYTNTLAGAPIPVPTGDPLADVDYPLVINGGDGAKHTLLSAVLMKSPALTFSTQKTLVGAAEFAGILVNAAEWNTTYARYKLETGATFADTGWTGPSLIKTQGYKLDWGTPGDPFVPVTGFGGVRSQDGMTFESTVNLQPIEIDDLGIVQYRFVSLTASVKLKPVGPTFAQIDAALKLQGAGAGRGTDLAAAAHQLTITGADNVVYLTIPAAALKTEQDRFGAKELRNGEIVFEAIRTFSAAEGHVGEQLALYTLAAS